MGWLYRDKGGGQICGRGAWGIVRGKNVRQKMSEENFWKKCIWHSAGFIGMWGGKFLRRGCLGNFSLGKCLTGNVLGKYLGKISDTQLALSGWVGNLWGGGCLGNCLWGKMSGGKCPGKISGENICDTQLALSGCGEANLRRGCLENFSWGKMPGRKCPGKVSGKNIWHSTGFIGVEGGFVGCLGNCLWGKMSGGKCPGIISGENICDTQLALSGWRGGDKYAGVPGELFVGEKVRREMSRGIFREISGERPGMSRSPCRIGGLHVQRLWFQPHWLTDRQTDT